MLHVVAVHFFCANSQNICRGRCYSCILSLQPMVWLCATALCLSAHMLVIWASQCTHDQRVKTLSAPVCEHCVYRYVTVQAPQGWSPHHLDSTQDLCTLHLLTVPDTLTAFEQALVCHLDLMLPFLPCLAGTGRMPQRIASGGLCLMSAVCLLNTLLAFILPRC